MLNRTDQPEHGTDPELTIQGKKQGISHCQDSFIPISKLQRSENKMDVKNVVSFKLHSNFCIINVITIPLYRVTLCIVRVMMGVNPSKVYLSRPPANGTGKSMLLKTTCSSNSIKWN